jgi:hypothetical protein
MTDDTVLMWFSHLDSETQTMVLTQNNAELTLELADGYLKSEVYEVFTSLLIDL